MRVFLLSLLLTGAATLSACSNSTTSTAAAGGGIPDAVQQCLPLPPTSPAPSIRPVNLGSAMDMQIATIMPPGQSGHFPSAAACPAGTLPPGSCALPSTDQLPREPSSYGPHIDDQRELYWNSGFKPGAFMDISQATPTHSFELTEPVVDTVRIYRDSFGVPVVHADTDYGVWYGAGYALAEDRLFLVDSAVRLARGTSGEVQGAGAVPADVQTRVLTYSEEEYAALEQTLSVRAQTSLVAHVAGINDRIAEVNADPTTMLMPQEFIALNYRPAPISKSDVLALGVLMTRFVASAGGDEMQNVAALKALEAQHGKELGRQIFSDVMWVDDNKADVTIPDQRFTNISTPAEHRAAVFEAAADYATSLPDDLIEGPGTGGFEVAQAKQLKLPEGFEWPVDPSLLAQAVAQWRDVPDHISASYMMVASPDITSDGSTLLVNGPQLGYSYPTLLAELEVHGGGYDARGVTVAGLPVVGIGYGERTVWGLTTGESKTIDSFIVELDPEDETGRTYFHNGDAKPMSCREETVDYRSTSNGVPNVSEPEPGINSTTIEVCRTVHGPVVARSADGRFARAVQYAMWMQEVQTIEGVQDWNRVDTLPEFLDAMAKVTWNENTMYADADGNIAYFHPGLHPWRHPAADQRLPIKGDGTQDHCGQLAFERTPKSINPDRGYLHNWNNKPALGWGEGVGGDASQEPSAADGRNVNWASVIEAELTGDGLTHGDLVEMDKAIGRIDPRAAALLAPVLACDGRCDLSAEAQDLLTILKGWDLQHYNDAIDINADSGDEGSLDTPAATIFGYIADAMVEDITKEVLPQAFIDRHARRGNHPYDAGTFHKLLAKLLDPNKSSIPVQYDWLKGRSTEEFVKASMETALAELQEDFDSTDPSSFRRIHARASVCALAQPLVGPCLDMPHQDRGSWLKIVGFVPSAN